MLNQKVLPKRPGDELLERPPEGVLISLFMLRGKHWSDCIVEDSRPKLEDAPVLSSRAEAKRLLAKIDAHAPRPTTCEFCGSHDLEQVHHCRWACVPCEASAARYDATCPWEWTSGETMRRARAASQDVEGRIL